MDKTFSAFNWRSVPDKYPRKVQHLNTKRIISEFFDQVDAQFQSIFARYLSSITLEHLTMFTEKVAITAGVATGGLR